MTIQQEESVGTNDLLEVEDPVTRAFELLDERLASAIADWRLRAPTRTRGRLVEQWVREGQELIQTRARFLLLARQYGYVDGWR